MSVGSHTQRLLPSLSPHVADRSSPRHSATQRGNDGACLGGQRHVEGALPPPPLFDVVRDITEGSWRGEMDALRVNPSPSQPPAAAAGGAAVHDEGSSAALMAQASPLAQHDQHVKSANETSSSASGTPRVQRHPHQVRVHAHRVPSVSSEATDHHGSTTEADSVERGYTNEQQRAHNSKRNASKSALCNAPSLQQQHQQPKQEEEEEDDEMDELERYGGGRQEEAFLANMRNTARRVNHFVQQTDGPTVSSSSDSESDDGGKLKRKGKTKEAAAAHTASSATPHRTNGHRMGQKKGSSGSSSSSSDSVKNGNSSVARADASSLTTRSAASTTSASSSSSPSSSSSFPHTPRRETKRGSPHRAASLPSPQAETAATLSAAAAVGVAPSKSADLREAEKERPDIGTTDAPAVPLLLNDLDGELLDVIRAYYQRKRTTLKSEGTGDVPLHSRPYSEQQPHRDARRLHHESGAHADGVQRAHRHATRRDGRGKGEDDEGNDVVDNDDDEDDVPFEVATSSSSVRGQPLHTHHHDSAYPFDSGREELRHSHVRTTSQSWGMDSSGLVAGGEGFLFSSRSSLPARQAQPRASIRNSSLALPAAEESTSSTLPSTSFLFGGAGRGNRVPPAAPRSASPLVGAVPTSPPPGTAHDVLYRILSSPVASPSLSHATATALHRAAHNGNNETDTAARTPVPTPATATPLPPPSMDDTNGVMARQTKPTAPREDQQQQQHPHRRPLHAVRRVGGGEETAPRAAAPEGTETAEEGETNDIERTTSGVRGPRSSRAAASPPPVRRAAFFSPLSSSSLPLPSTPHLSAFAANGAFPSAAVFSSAAAAAVAAPLSSLPTYSSTSFVRAYVSDISLSLEPAVIVSGLAAALNIMVVYFLQQHVLDTRDHLGLFLIGSYLIFSSYYMIYYFLERFSSSFRRIASQDKKFYIIGNLLKAGILISITPFACYHLIKIIVFDEWESNILRNLGCIYAIPDFISMIIVKRMRWSTWIHHFCVVLFNYFSIMNDYQHENVCRCVVVYAAFSSFAYCVNVLLASRFLGVSAATARVLSFVALVVYVLCCAVNWAWQVYYLRRLITGGHDHWTVYVYMLLISLVMWDDVVLNKWLLNYAKNTAQAAAQQKLLQRRQRELLQQQQYHQHVAGEEARNAPRSRPPPVS